MSTPQSFGRYRVEGELGRGAMGVVYRGFDPALDRAVAIKVIRVDEKTADLPMAELERRFLREAKVAARISHPNIVTVFDAGREGHLLYLVMELVEGQSLQERMRAGQFPEPAAAYEIVAQAADALAAAHELGVVHRDVKPANILLTAEGKVKVSDFGVAKAMGEETGLTRTGTVVGSPAYMAPEQIRGQQVDGRADVFSLAVILYELLLRKKPFPADTLTTLIFQILHEDPFADASDSAIVGPRVTALLQRSLAKDPEERTPDAATFAAEARALIATARVEAVAPPAVVATGEVGESVPPSNLDDAEGTGPTRLMDAPPAPPPAAGPAPEETPRRTVRWLPVLLLGGALAALLVATVLMLRSASEPSPPAAAAVLQGRRTPTPAPTVAIRMVATPQPSPAPTSPVTEATVWPTITPAVGVEPGALAPATPRPTRTPPPPPTAVPPTLPPVVATFRCQKGAEFNVSPEEAKIEIRGTVIGIADDWDGVGGGKVYEFPKPGVYYVKLFLEGYPTKWIKIIVDPEADEEIADIDTDLD